MENHYKLFYNNPILIFLKYENGEPVDIPIIAYLCKETENNPDNKETETSYLNVFYENREHSGSQNTISIINKKVEHPIFNETFLFTEEPIVYENLEKIKRFSVFIKNAFYFFNKFKNLYFFL